MSEKVKIVAITGPTATGKTALAVKLAQMFDGEIVSVDSRQVYSYMDLGTGKDLEEYGNVPYHLINIADPECETYNLSEFCRDAFAAVDDIRKRGKLPILCGGTALYLDALLKGYRLPGGQLPPRERGVARSTADPDAAFSFTPPFELAPLVIGVLFDRSVVRERIEKRLDTRFEAGMIEEVRKLHDLQGVSYEKLEFFGLEYREIAFYLQGKCSFEEMRQSLLDKIRQFAKRQDIFFRKIERSGQEIFWCREGKEPDPFELVKLFLENRELPPVTFRLADVDYGKKK
ncbi:MAG: tRNA dimethylallyltransferase [Lentisphaeria bacterium]|nr:tRNA dimethylallyltransferase [Lentisphaeria bacterium]